MKEDIVTRLALLRQAPHAPQMGIWSRDLRDAIDEIHKLRAEIVDRHLGFKADVNWEPNSRERWQCVRYARERGWTTLWDRINEIERVFRETGRLP